MKAERKQDILSGFDQVKTEATPRGTSPQKRQKTDAMQYVPSQKTTQSMSSEASRRAALAAASLFGS